MIIGGVAVLALIIGVGAWLFDRRSSVDKPNVSIVEQPQGSTSVPELRCSEIPDDQRVVNLVVNEMAQSSEVSGHSYQVMVDSQYLVNVVKVVLIYSSDDLRFDGVNGDKSVFSVEAPEERLSDRIIATRGITGRGQGLLGEGLFATFEFTDVRKNKQGKVPTPTIDIEKSAVYFNDGCVTKAILRIQNPEL